MCFYSLFHDKIKKKRGDPTEIGHSREGASTKAYVIINQKVKGKLKWGNYSFGTELWAAARRQIC